MHRFWFSIRSYKKQLVNWGRMLGLAWLKFAVAALVGILLSILLFGLALVGTTVLKLNPIIIVEVLCLFLGYFVIEKLFFVGINTDYIFLSGFVIECVPI